MGLLASAVKRKWTCVPVNPVSGESASIDFSVMSALVSQAGLDLTAMSILMTVPLILVIMVVLVWMRLMAILVSVSQALLERNASIQLITVLMNLVSMVELARVPRTHLFVNAGQVMHPHPLAKLRMMSAAQLLAIQQAH
jgi:hypothetical protein